MFNIQTGIALTVAQAEAILESWLNRKVTCKEIVPLKGGKVNTVLRLAFDQPPYTAVIKLSTPDDGPYSLDKEAANLYYLHKRTCFPCPEVYAEDGAGERAPFAFLLLECLPGVSLAQAQKAGLVSSSDLEDLDRQLARILLELHSHTRATFGKPELPCALSWAELFVPRLHEVRAQTEINRRLSSNVLADIDYAIARAEDLLTSQGKPTLVHADIWAGNIIVQPKGDGWQITGIVDPAVEYADVEMELAYLESFGKSRSAFMEVYTRQHPLRAGYEVRRLFYWLLTYMIHVWLFGDQQYCDYAAKVAVEIRQRV